MPKVMLGTGAARVVIQLEKVPKTGDQVTVTPASIVWSQCGGSLNMVNRKYELVGNPGRAVVQFETVSWFDIREV